GKLGVGAAETEGKAYADVVAEFEQLTVDREFAEASYQAARAAYDTAQAEARRQSRYLAAHVLPTLAESPRYPERGTLLAVLGGFLLMAWAIAVLIFYSVRDRR
ncbi:MAG: capsule biosynthesis protein, partial [Fuscovulum sp.]|nr:capsule biosynthesis protein [Fuscovulum sp.]